MKEFNKLRIAFSGPSGTGKTTLCKHVNEMGINWASTSAWDVMNLQEKDLLYRKFGYKQGGHQNVIQLGHSNPEFAIAFQDMVAQARARQLMKATLVDEGLVIDRSPIDNIVYMYNQASMYMGQSQIERFIIKAIYSMNNTLDGIIFIPTTHAQPIVEDNHSRIANIMFQRFISGIFQWVINQYDDQITVPILQLNTWDLEDRKNRVEQFLIELQHNL